MAKKEDLSEVLLQTMRKINEDPDGVMEQLRLISNLQRDREKLAQLDKALKKLNETFDLVKIGVKYLIFDLEATRRERDHLRQLLEDSDEDNLGENQ